MTLSYHIFKIPYSLLWHIMKIFRKKPVVAFYCDNELDYEILRNIKLESAVFVSRNKKIADYLRSKGIAARTIPAFPDAVIMARHALHRFPCGKIVKIGLRHGPYHFKKMIDADKYNAFDLFLFTSEKELEVCRKVGISNAVNGGYPKLDSFKQPERLQRSRELFARFNFSDLKKTLLFSATWDGSGISAIDKWIDRIDSIAQDYNIIVTLHSKMSSKYFDKLHKNPLIKFACPIYWIECMLMADFLISDTSSIIGEFCALDKPIITFKVEPGKRLTCEIIGMINEISWQINDLGELAKAIAAYETDPQLKEQNRAKWNKIMFDDPDISHSRKATEIILDFLKTDLHV